MKVVHVTDIQEELKNCKTQIAKISQAVGFQISAESAIRQIQESLSNLEELAFDHDCAIEAKEEKNELLIERAKLNML